jgi:hypothetical protein
MTNPTLSLKFHGRIIDQLGLQMYHSPVAAIAEMIANSWDADARHVRITLPDDVNSDASFEIYDDGVGMTLEQCQKRFLNVGYNRRGRKATGKTAGGRPILGRKGIGKFAGFGIAHVIEIDTISEVTGEHVVFQLDLDVLRGEVNDEDQSEDATLAPPSDEESAQVTEDDYLSSADYVSLDEIAIPTKLYEPAKPERRSEHGTTIRLLQLEIGGKPSQAVFLKSMSRRFLLHERAQEFEIKVNENELSSIALTDVQFIFPRDYAKAGVSDAKRPSMTVSDDGLWATEQIDESHSIRWQVAFYKDTIDEPELTGVAVFANHKLAQTPFFFNLIGGLGAQQGQPYLSGRVEANYLDEFRRDVIATERQRLNWELSETSSLLKWGQARLQELLRLWNKLRTEEKVNTFQSQLTPLRSRLDKLSKRDQKTVESALRHMAGLKGINSEMFTEVAGSVLTAWEGGHLQDLIQQLADSDDLDDADLVGILTEADVLSTIHAGDIARSQIAIYKGLAERVRHRDLESAVRDYIAENPFLISPKWQVFARETRISSLIREATAEAALDKDDAWRGRVDLVLSSGDQLLVLEFMRPGVSVDWDHLNRFERYVRVLTTRTRANTAFNLTSVTGYLIADNLAKDATVVEKLASLARDQMHAMTWEILLSQAEVQWKDFAVALRERTPADDRLPE